MVITIRFIDWVIFFFVFLCWCVDHWFTTYGLKILADSHKIEFFSHTIVCFAMITVFIATLCVVFKLFHYSFFFGMCSLIYTIFIPITSYFWNAFLMTDQMILAIMISFLALIATIIGTIVICKRNIQFLLAATPLLLWHILLFAMNATCLMQ